MTKRKYNDPMFDEEEIEDEDPLGEQAFAEAGFQDAEDGGPDFNAPGLDDSSVDKRAARPSQKIPGFSKSEQHQVNTPSEDRPESQGVIVRERGGLSKGDPAVGGTRPL